MGLSFATNTVTVGGQTAYRKGEYFRKELSVDNSSAPVWQSVTVAATGQTSVSGNEFVPKTPEIFSYDADGNLTNDGRWTYIWDAENRLVRMNNNSNVPDGAKMTLNFAYDSKGRRISKTVSNWVSGAWALASDTRFAYDGWNLIATLNSQLSTINSFLWGLDLSGSRQGAGGVGGLLAITDQSTINNQPSTHFAAFDANGNVTALVNAADGTGSARYEYSPFGEVLRATGPVAKPNPLRFSSRYRDDEADVISYPRRPYSPSTGRWLSRDPAAERGGRNLYAFARNSFGVDPLGLVELHYINYPQWEPIDLHGNFPTLSGFPVVEYLWVGHYLTFDAADSAALDGNGVLVLKYTAHASLADCSSGSAVAPKSREWYFATPFRLNADGTVIPSPVTYAPMFDDGQAHPLFQIADVSMRAMVQRYGGASSGPALTRGHFWATVEARVVHSSSFESSDDAWTPGSELEGFDVRDINGHELGGRWAYFMVDQVPQVWSTESHWSKKISVDFEWNDCLCYTGRNTWNYTPDPALASQGANRLRYVGAGNDPNYTSINLLTRPHN